MAGISERVRDRIAAQFQIPVDMIEERVRLDTRLVEDLGAGELDIVELALSLEEEFGVDFPEDEFGQTVRTVRDVVEFVSTRLGGER